MLTDPFKVFFIDDNDIVRFKLNSKGNWIIQVKGILWWKDYYAWAYGSNEYFIRVSFETEDDAKKWIEDNKWCI